MCCSWGIHYVFITYEAAVANFQDYNPIVKHALAYIFSSNLYTVHEHWCTRDLTVLSMQIYYIQDRYPIMCSVVFLEWL